MILERETADRQNKVDADEFMSRLCKYMGDTELTREICLDLMLTRTQVAQSLEKSISITSFSISSMLTCITLLCERGDLF